MRKKNRTNGMKCFVLYLVYSSVHSSLAFLVPTFEEVNNPLTILNFVLLEDCFEVPSNISPL